MNDLNEILSRPTQHQTTETYLVDQSLLFLHSRCWPPNRSNW